MQNTYNYIENHIKDEDPILKELTRQTHLKAVQPRMLSGHLQGDFLSLLVTIKGANRILELGTFTGYSTICLARATSENGQVHTIDINDELFSLAQKFFDKSGQTNKITQHHGEALEIMTQFDAPFDLVFIDADKREYPEYYDALFNLNLVKKGTVIIADNTLWSGKVIEKADPKDLYLKGILDFNKQIATDSRVDVVIIPLRDGITLATVK